MLDMPTSNAVLSLVAPLSGVLVPISDVPDPVFAEKMVGDGISIDPIDQVLRAPCDGVVTQIHAALHAVTITSSEGVEVLIHIGLDTVALKGSGFTVRTTEGAAVRVGDPLIEFNTDFLAPHARSLLTQVVITNGEKVLSYIPHAGVVTAGRDVVLELMLNAQAIRASVPTHDVEIESEDIIIPNPSGLHARPAAVLVNAAKQFASDVRLVRDGKAVNAKSVVALMGFDIKKNDIVRLCASGPDAAQVLAVLVPLVRSGGGENVSDVPEAASALVEPASRSVPAKSDNPDVLRGVSASPGLVVGNIFQLRHAEIDVPEIGESETEERQRLISAVRLAKEELTTLQKQMQGKSDSGKAAIFAAHQELIEDPDLLEVTYAGISQGKSAMYAWKKAYTAQAETLASLSNELLAARANDLRDVGRRVLYGMMGIKPEMAPLPDRVILVAEDLTPSDTASLDRSKVLGFCTTKGGATSHVAILARSLSIPAIAAIDEDALDLENGILVVLDGTAGELRLRPSADEVEQINVLQKKMEEQRQRELEETMLPSVTTDGHGVKVLGNIGGLADAEQCVALGGEGVGLLRSEFLFLQRVEAPSEEEQASVYAGIARVLDRKRSLVVRTLDVGGDKPLAYLPVPPEENPFLGVRGIRLSMERPELLRTQIRAILKAAEYTRLHIMFPMVSTIEELREARKIIEEENVAMRNAVVEIGIMIEVPAAAVMADVWAEEVDFFSIGTNDLTQYVLAIDRGHPKLAKSADGLHPAVLRLIGQTVIGAHKHGKWVGVCGGLASEPAAVPVLIGLGVDELSVSVPSIPAIKALIRTLNYKKCKALARELVNMSNTADVRRRLKEGIEARK